MSDLAPGGAPRRAREEAAGETRSTRVTPRSVPELTAVELRAVFEAAPDGILVVGADGRIQAVNARAEQLFGYARAELLGRPVETLVPEASRDVHRSQREAYAARPHARPMGIGLQLLGRRMDGSEFPVEISLSPAETRRGTVILATVRDISERQRLRAFGAQALRATEEERKRVARELHDDTLQTLSALLIRLRVAMRAPEGEAARELLRELRAEIAEAAEGVRRIARHLRPPALDELGVSAAIVEHCRSMREATGLPISVETDAVDAALGEDAQLVLYRIVQEALSNALRHAAASRIAVRLRREGGHVVAEIEDDGRGFQPLERDARGVSGLGIFGMNERASYVNGRVAIESRPGGGTTVRAEIPVRDEAPHG